MWAAQSKWRSDLWCVKYLRRDVHNYLLRLWFQPKDYDTPRKRTSCLKKMGRFGVRVVKVKIVRV